MISSLAGFFSLAFHGLRHGAMYLARSRGLRGDAREDARGRALHGFLLAMGPVYVKLGQVLSTRSDLVSAPIVRHLQRLQDDVPPMDPAHTRRILRAAYGDDLPFAELAPEPVSSASIAQVHRAVLPDGRIAAVKIVKHGVRRGLRVNLRLLRALARIAHAVVPSLRPAQAPARLADLSALLLRQTDMPREAEEMAAIRANFEGHPFVRVPEVLTDLCRPDVLVMEYVEGIPGRDFRAVEIEPRRLAHRLIDAMQTMIYLHGVFHADAHPGNLLFTPAGQVILLDFGITERLTEDERWALASFYHAVIRREWATAAARYTRAFVVDRAYLEARWPLYEEEMVACLREHFGSRKKWDTSLWTRDTVRIFERYRARESTQWVKIELALVSLEGFVAQIDPDVDIWEASRRFNERYSLYLSREVKAVFDEHYGATIPRSLEAEKRADQSLVAPTHLHRYFVPAAYPLFIARAHGSTLEDLDGRRYVELHGGYGPYVLGYAHPAVEAAIRETVEHGNVCALATLPEVELMETLVAALPGAEKGLFANSGTEACQIAVKLCRAFRGRQTVAKCEGHYHGFSDQGTVSSWFRVHGPPERPLPIAGSAGVSPAATDGTFVLQYGHPDALDQLRAAAPGLACVMVEPLPASMVAYDVEWLRGLRQVCTETGVPLVFDEVITGFRVGWGGFQGIAGIRPDLTVLGKVIGGGLPCGAVVGRRELVDMARSTHDPFRDYEERAFTGGTFAGNRLTCAAGLAQLRHLRAHPEIYARLETMTHSLVAGFGEVVERRGVACRVRGFNSIFTLSFRHRPPRWYREKYSGSDVRANIALAYYMRRFGVYMAELHTYFIGAAHTDADLATVTSAFDQSIAAMREQGFFAE
ncbi:MAG TPA: aminotransferase class III-fold pyridoxal phosphate-dependent enzyme [Longimicrobium sp.]|nr:aminotransferase class III-fold pyridoxal phosphate-dependent enzyme [Longimicrobium sp.]